MICTSYENIHQQKLQFFASKVQGLTLFSSLSFSMYSLTIDIFDSWLYFSSSLMADKYVPFHATTWRSEFCENHRHPIQVEAWEESQGDLCSHYHVKDLLYFFILGWWSPMNKIFPLRPPPGGARSVTVTAAPSRWKPGRSPTSGWNKSRLRGCAGLRVTSGGGVTMRTFDVLFWVVPPVFCRKRGRNEVSICSRVVVFLIEYPRAPSSSRWPWWPGRRSQCPMWVLGRLTVECRLVVKPWLLFSCNYGAMWRLHGAIQQSDLQSELWRKLISCSM